MFRNLRIAAVEHNLRTLLLTFGDQTLDSRLALRRNYRTHLHAFIEAVSHTQGGGGFSNRITESFLRFTNGYGYGDCEATLSGAAEGAIADDLRGHFHI